MKDESDERVFRRDVQDIKARSAKTAPEALQALIDDAVGEVRQEKRAGRQAEES